VYSSRSDKRYKRAMLESDKIFKYLDKIENRQYELTKEIYYLKGQKND